MPDLRASSISPALAPTARNTGTPADISRTDEKTGDFQPIHRSAGGLAAGDDQPPYAGRDQAFGNIGHRLFDGMPGCIAAML